MTSHLVLIFGLGVSIILLIYLVATRIQTERRHAATAKLLGISGLAELLRTNSVDGKIHVVASRVSELLKASFGCSRIIFLRKQRGLLDLNYYYGLTKFNRGDFRLPYTKALGERLRESYLPQPLDALGSVLSAQAMARLRADEFDLFFPIFWRENLYGVYFVKSTIATATPGFQLLIANLAHSLSAAYHVRWHEARFERLEQEISEAGVDSIPALSASATPAKSSQSAWPILKLVRHANSESLVPQLIDTIQQQVGAFRAVLVYETKTATGPLLLAKSGTVERLDTPSRESFDRLMRELGTARLCSLESIVSPGLTWLEHLKQTGFSYVARFAPTPGRKGLILIDSPQSPTEMERELSEIEEPMQVLMTNAEQFDEMQELSFTDSLTGLANQRYFRKRLREEIDRARRYNRSLALIIFDLDDLKSVNDRYGHLAGDNVIQRMGPILRSCIRAIDIVARYGGDEFCVIMPEADGVICERFMERLHLKFSGNRFPLSDLGVEITCTISLGGAVFPLQAGTDDELIFAADMALLQAKARGRNQYLLYSQPICQPDGTTTESAGF
jgi:diguanylate cyclase (GGDEF)-like protein